MSRIAVPGGTLGAGCQVRPSSWDMWTVEETGSCMRIVCEGSAVCCGMEGMAYSGVFKVEQLAWEVLEPRYANLWVVRCDAQQRHCGVE